MGVTTTYVGQILIEPPLAPAEAAYLNTLATTRHNERVEGTYVLPQNPMAVSPPGDAAGPDRVASDRPSYWCPWTPCPEGHCLQYNGLDCTSPGEQWLRFLIDTFLRRGAAGRRDRSGALAGFTFDHVLNGVLVGSPNDTMEVFALRVRNSRVTRQILMEPLFPGARWGVDGPAEEEYLQRRLDREGSWAAWLLAREDDAVAAAASVRT